MTKVKAERKNGREEAPDPEVLAKAQRRRFTAEYKVDILRRAAGCAPNSGELGELLRGEGLYSSHITAWRKQRDEGALAGLTDRKRGRKPKRRDPVALENERLRREVMRLEHRLLQAEAIIDVQKKVSALLGIPLPSDDKNGRDD